MVDTGQTQVPICRHEVVWTLNDLVHQEELRAVQDDPGDVADEEHHDNADKNCRQVQLSINSSVGRFLVSVPLVRKDLQNSTISNIMIFNK